MALVRGYLVFSVLVWFGYGLFCLFQPDFLVETAGVQALTATGSTELRAMYGGLQAGLGVLAMAALLRADLVRGVLITLAVLTGGLGIARLMGLAMDGGISPYTVGALVFEFGSVALAMASLSRWKREASA